VKLEPRAPPRPGPPARLGQPARRARLDAVTLEAAISALERLRGPHRIIGMISHLAAIEERMPRKLRVKPDRPGGHATVIHEDGLDSAGK